MTNRKHFNHAKRNNMWFSIKHVLKKLIEKENSSSKKIFGLYRKSKVFSSFHDG